MYLWTQEQDMPLTPGIEWTKKNGSYQKRIMTSQMSLPQIQWILYLETTDICVDSDGNRHRIEHGYYRGEFEFEHVKPDGYLFLDGIHHFFEFLGNSITYQ